MWAYILCQFVGYRVGRDRRVHLAVSRSNMSVCKSCQAACGHHLGRTLDTLRGQTWYRQVGREATSGNNKMRICFPNILHNRILDTEMVKNGKEGAWMLKSAWWIPCPKDLLHPRPSLCSNLPRLDIQHVTTPKVTKVCWDEFLHLVS